MYVDPDFDVVLSAPGQCLSCGQRFKRGKSGYCSRCMHRMRTSPAGAEPPPPDPALEAKRELARRELCRRRLLPFVLRILPAYAAGWFHEDLAARLERFVQKVERAESPRMLLSCPPRIGKTELASKALVAWDLGRNPHHRIISATHSDRLAMDNSRDVLNYIRHEKYKTVFQGLSLDKDNKAASGWRTSQGGSYKPVGAGAGIAGYGADILVLDDLHRDQEAYSPTVRDNVWRWYRSSAVTRLMPGGGVLCIGTRWTLDDVIGRLIDEEGVLEDGGVWENVRYPAVATQDEYRLPDGRIVHTPEPRATLLRKEGEALHPARYPLRLLKPYMRDPVTWQALYQGDPVAGEAALFTESMMESTRCLMSDLPERLRHYSAWDLAISQKNSGDWTVNMTAGVDDDDVLWIVDIDRARMDGHDIVERLLDSYLRFSQDAIGVERGHLSMAINPFLEKRMAERRLYGVNVVELEHGNKDKVSRARPIQARVRQGKVRIPTDAPWFAAFEKELLEFPAGRNDDQVDAFSWIGSMLEDMLTPLTPQQTRKESWRDKLRRGASGKNWRTA